MEQGELVFETEAEEGVDPLVADWNAEEDRAAAIWNIPLRKKVRITLEGMRGECEGVIRLAVRPSIWEAQQKLLLRMGSNEFINHQIESCTVIETK